MTSTLAEKVRPRSKFRKNIPQGLKPRIDSLDIVPGMNPRPTARMSFSAISSVLPKRRPMQTGLSRRGTIAGFQVESRPLKAETPTRASDARHRRRWHEQRRRRHHRRPRHGSPAPTARNTHHGCSPAKALAERSAFSPPALRLHGFLAQNPSEPALPPACHRHSKPRRDSHTHTRRCCRQAAGSPDAAVASYSPQCRRLKSCLARAESQPAPSSAD
jgi:hypothetical protein